MIMTAAALFEIEKHSTVQSIIESCNGVSLDVLREKEQHLFPGMVNEDVINVSQSYADLKYVNNIFLMRVLNMCTYSPSPETRVSTYVWPHYWDLSTFT